MRAYGQQYHVSQGKKNIIFRVECVHVLCYFCLMSAQTRYSVMMWFCLESDPVDSLLSVEKCLQHIFIC